MKNKIYLVVYDDTLESAQNLDFYAYSTLDGVDEEQYNEEVKYMQEMKDIYEFFDYFCQSYDCSTYLDVIARGIVEEFAERRAADEEAVKLFEKDVKSDVAGGTFFEVYDVNVFENHYFRGNW